jgi:gas vesicle protein
MYFSAGALLGAGIALLYAPKRGRELREQVSDMTGDAVVKMKDFGGEAKRTINAKLQRGKQYAEEKGAAFSSAVEEAKEQYH